MRQYKWFFKHLFFVFISLFAITFFSEFLMASTPHASKKSSIVESSPLLLPMHPLVISVIQGDKVQAYCTVQLSLKGRDIFATSSIRDKMFHVHEAIFIDLYDSLSQIWGTGYVLTAASLQKRLHTVCERVVGSGLLESIIIHQFFVNQPKTLLEKGYMSSINGEWGLRSYLLSSSYVGVSLKKKGSWRA